MSDFLLERRVPAQLETGLAYLQNCARPRGAARLHRRAPEARHAVHVAPGRAPTPPALRAAGTAARVLVRSGSPPRPALLKPRAPPSSGGATPPRHVITDAIPRCHRRRKWPRTASIETGGLHGASFCASPPRRRAAAFVCIPFSRRRWRLPTLGLGRAAPRRQRGLASSGQHRSASLGGASTSMMGFVDRLLRLFAGAFLAGSSTLTWRPPSPPLLDVAPARVRERWRIGGLRLALKMARASSAQGLLLLGSGAAGAGSLGARRGRASRSSAAGAWLASRMMGRVRRMAAPRASPASLTTFARCPNRANGRAGG